MGYSRSRAKCVPLQYQSSATRGVKQALCASELSLNPNLSLVSTVLQEKTNTVEKNSNINQESRDKVSISESGMFYELLNRKGMECEKYQDCSWFQQTSVKPDCKSTSSPAEIFDSFIDADEFNMSLQCAGAHFSPWEDDYLEVFNDDILEENHKLKEKKNYIDTSNENFYDNFRENNFDSCNIDYSLKKSDSMDSIKNVSLTNPSEVIPITYKEKLNNQNYGLTKLIKIKNEIKQEIDSPKLSPHYMDADNGDLIIGREEEVEEMNFVEDVNKKEIINFSEVKVENKLEKVLPECAVTQKGWESQKKSEENNYSKYPLPVKTENGNSKYDLNLDTAKLNFEPQLNMSTPDLDFMDLVNFINEEMRNESNAANSNSDPKSFSSFKTETNKDFTTTEQSCKTTIQPSGSVTSGAPSLPQTQPLLNLPEVFNCTIDVKDGSTVDINEIFGPGVSIAERIKTSGKRRTRKSLKDSIDSEDDEDYSSDGDYDDGDEDYDYREDFMNRRSATTKRRAKSNSTSSEGKKEVDSYREKRDKNNEASRRSRQNRKARERHMYETLEEEERRNVKLKAEADVLEKQVASLRQLLVQVVLHKGGTT